MAENTRSAWVSSAAGWVVVTASTVIPARLPASTPAGASSTTTHSAAGTPSAAAARRYGSGSGFPCSTSSPVTSTSGTGNPTEASRRAASSRPPDVTTAHRPRRAKLTHSRAPGIAASPSTPVFGLVPADPQHLLGRIEVRRQHPHRVLAPAAVDDRQHLIGAQLLLGRPPEPGPLDHPQRIDQDAVQVEQDG